MVCELLDQLSLASRGAVPRQWKGGAGFHAWLFFTGGKLHNTVVTALIVLSIVSICFGNETFFAQPLWVASNAILLGGRVGIEADLQATEQRKQARGSALWHSVIIIVCVGEVLRLRWGAEPGEEIALVEYAISILILIGLLPVFARTFGLHWWEAGLSSLALAALLAVVSVRIDHVAGSATQSLIAPSRWSQMLWRVSSLEFVLILTVLFANEAAMRMVYDRLSAEGVCCDQLEAQCDALARSNERKEFEIRMAVKRAGKVVEEAPIDLVQDHRSCKEVDDHVIVIDIDDDDARSTSHQDIESASFKSMQSHHTAKLGKDGVAYMPLGA